METSNIKIQIELNTVNLMQADAIMRKMLKNLSTEELVLIEKSVVTKTILEVEVDANEARKR